MDESRSDLKTFFPPSPRAPSLVVTDPGPSFDPRAIWPPSPVFRPTGGLVLPYYCLAEVGSSERNTRAWPDQAVPPWRPPQALDSVFLENVSTRSPAHHRPARIAD